MHGSGIRGCGVPGAARATAVAASSSRRRMSNPIDLIEAPARKGTLPWFDQKLFKPIRVKLALRLRRCIRPRCELAHSPFGAM